MPTILGNKESSREAIGGGVIDGSDQPPRLGIRKGEIAARILQGKKGNILPRFSSVIGAEKLLRPHLLQCTGIFYPLHHTHPSMHVVKKGEIEISCAIMDDFWCSGPITVLPCDTSINAP